MVNFVQAKLQADEIRGTFESKAASIKTILVQIEDNLNVPEDFKVSQTFQTTNGFGVGKWKYAGITFPLMKDKADLKQKWI